MEKISFFVSAMIISEILLISVFYLQNFLIKDVLVSLPEKIRNFPNEIKIAMAKSFINNLFIMLLATLFVKGVIMIMPWKF